MLEFGNHLINIIAYRGTRLRAAGAGSYFEFLLLGSRIGFRWRAVCIRVFTLRPALYGFYGHQCSALAVVSVRFDQRPRLLHDSRDVARVGECIAECDADE